MASIVRPTMLRQTGLVAASKRAFSSTNLTSHLVNKPSACTFTRTRTPVGSVLTLASIRVAAFHASVKRSILTPLPQTINGTANDAAPVPSPSPSHGSYHWTFERIIAAGLVPLTVAPFVAGTLNPLTDALLCGTILIHSHIGFEACITDYFPRWRVPKTRATFDWILRIFTVGVGVGFYEFETNDVGLTEAIKRIWKA